MNRHRWLLASIAASILLAGCSNHAEVDNLVQSGHDLVKQRDYVGAEARFDQATKLRPNDPWLWLCLGRHRALVMPEAEQEIGSRYQHIRHGIQALLDGLKHNPQNATATEHVAMGLAHWVGHRREGARYRILFSQDESLQSQLREAEGAASEGKDVFVFAERWYLKALVMADVEGRIAKGTHTKSPDDGSSSVLFLLGGHAECLSHAALAKQQDGCSLEQAAAAWAKAAQAWARLEELYPPEYLEIADQPKWKQRCEAERRPDTLIARELLYKAIQEGDESGPFEAAFESWNKVIAEAPLFAEDEDLFYDVSLAMARYTRVTPTPSPAAATLAKAFQPLLVRLTQGGSQPRTE